MLDFVDKTFDQMPFTVQPSIILMRLFSPLMRRYYGLYAAISQIINERLSRVAAISDHPFKCKTFNQVEGTSNVVPLPSTQAKAQGITKGIHRNIDFGTKPTTTASKRLLTAFFVRQQNTDEPERWCCQSSHFPCQGHRQSVQTFFATPHVRTSAQNACKSYSISRIRQAASAIVLHCDLPISRLLRSGDTLLRLCQHKHSGLLIKSPVFSSIGYCLVSHLS